MTKGTKVEWDSLSKKEKEDFAALCDRFVGIQSVEDAKEYYGNKEKLIKDAKGVTNDQ